MTMKSTYINLLSCLSIALLVSCTATESMTYTYSDARVSGDFLFEGPNTLQGPMELSAESLANDLSISSKSLEKVSITEIIVQFPDEDTRTVTESLLVQVVSDELELITLGTLNPLSDGLTQSLNINQEADLLPYLKSGAATLVVDVNLSSDLDAASLNVTMNLTAYTNK